MSLLFLPHHIHFLAAQPQWISLSWEARGMAMQLMSLGDFEEGQGTLPSEDGIWRNCLGFPSSYILKEAQKHIYVDVHDHGDPWEMVWKPQLLNWFRLIDQAFIQKKPEYAAQIGRYWHPLIDHWRNASQNDTTTVKSKKKKPTNNQQSHVLADQSLVNQTGRKIFENTHDRTVQVSITQSSAMSIDSGKRPKRLKDKIHDPIWDYPLIRYSSQSLRNSWDPPISSEARSNLWNNACSLLAIPDDKKSEMLARQFLGKLIKEFGEQKVATAVAQLMVRPIKPADPKSFLRKQLSDMGDGTSAEQKARKQRAHVPL